MKCGLHSTYLFILLAFIIIVITGCEDRSISPYEVSTATYSIYGALNLHKTPNYIRVKDLTIPFDSDSAKNMDAKVTFEDLQDGTSSELRDSVINFSGDYTHNFAVDQQLEPGKMYKVTVEGSDGETVTSTATMPSITEVELSVNGSPLSEQGKVGCRQPLTFTYKNVTEPAYIQMHIGFKYEGKYQWDKVGFVDQLRHADNANEMFLKMSPSDLLIEVFPLLPDSTDDPSNPTLDPGDLTSFVKCHELDSKKVKVRYFHFGPEWARIKGEDEPIDPTESPDVENGLGFLGGYRKEAFEFYIK